MNPLDVQLNNQKDLCQLLINKLFHSPVHACLQALINHVLKKVLQQHGPLMSVQLCSIGVEVRALTSLLTYDEHYLKMLHYPKFYVGHSNTY